MPHLFVGTSRTRLLAQMYGDIVALLLREFDFVNVHDDALWEALGMTAPSSEKITNACDVKVTDEDGFCVPLRRS